MWIAAWIRQWCLRCTRVFQLKSCSYWAPACPSQSFSFSFLWIRHALHVGVIAHRPVSPAHIFFFGFRDHAGAPSGSCSWSPLLHLGLDSRIYPHTLFSQLPLLRQLKLGLDNTKYPIPRVMQDCCAKCRLEWMSNPGTQSSSVRRGMWGFVGSWEHMERYPQNHLIRAFGETMETRIPFASWVLGKHEPQFS